MANRLEPNTCYHIFNHANGFENIFREEENYRYFLARYETIISPIAETYAYCLMPNHFHWVIRLRKKEVILRWMLERSSNQNFSKVSSFGKVSDVSGVGDVEKAMNKEQSISSFLSKQFANLFSSYTQAFNKKYNRMGSLFMKNFKREPILDKEYFLNAIIYTHRNPVHHGFMPHYSDWDYSSYNDIFANNSQLVEVDKLLHLFGGIEQLESIHQQHLISYDNPFIEKFESDDQANSLLRESRLPKQAEPTTSD